MCSGYSTWHLENWRFQQARSMCNTTTFFISEDLIDFVEYTYTTSWNILFAGYIQMIIFEILLLISKVCNYVKYILKWHFLKYFRQITNPRNSTNKEGSKIKCLENFAYNILPGRTWSLLKALKILLLG